VYARVYERLRLYCVSPKKKKKKKKMSPCKIIGQDFNRLIPRDKEIKLKHISRNTNMLAHEIAKFASNELCGGVLHGQVPMRMSILVLPPIYITLC
jgi:hypothetical protein